MTLVLVATTVVLALRPEAPAHPAGWYADPHGQAGERYWSGSAWTEHVR
jgi:hypothetical protein